MSFQINSICLISGEEAEAFNNVILYFIKKRIVSMIQVCFESFQYFTKTYFEKNYLAK